MQLRSTYASWKVSYGCSTLVWLYEEYNAELREEEEQDAHLRLEMLNRSNPKKLKFPPKH